MSTLKSPIVSYIFTHNARMRCLVRKIMEPLYIEYPDDNLSESERETIDTRDYYSAYSDRGSDEDDRDNIELFQPPVGTYTPLPISESDNLETEPLIIPEQASRSSSSESKKSVLNRKSKYVQSQALLEALTTQFGVSLGCQDLKTVGIRNNGYKRRYTFAFGSWRRDR